MCFNYIDHSVVGAGNILTEFCVKGFKKLKKAVSEVWH